MPEEDFEELAVSRPFPGLRSFNEDEAHLFFGRDGQSNKVVSLLERRAFVAVVGTSGCGKSSLVRAGLLPALFAGRDERLGAKWQVADFRPQNDPFGKLHVTLRSILKRDDKDANWLRQGASSVLKAVEAAREKEVLEPDEAILILVDQFEELFRYSIPQQSAAGDRDEKAEFVSLLLKTANKEARLYVAITMRSDFLGDCALFRDLPEAINASQYLVPRMTREQRQSAIEGPVRVAGAGIAPRLVRQLLNELGDDPDQLPVLQHALMRTWDSWFRGPKSGPIGVEDYNATGSLREALGNHADEVRKEAESWLGERGPDVIKRVFQRLRVRDANGRETRSPSSVRDLAAVAGASADDIRTVLDCFRDDVQGRTFVAPFRSVLPELSEDTQIDVTHESLLRCWPLLADKWVPEEEDSRRTYTRLASLAEAEGPDPENFLRGTLLDRTVEWWDNRKPNKIWAERYHLGFDAASEYLARSRQTDVQEKKLRREEREREQRRLEEERINAAKLVQERGKKRVAYVLSAISAVALALMIYSVSETRSARSDVVTHLLASKAALAASEGGASLRASVLLAATSLKRQSSPEAQLLIADALALLPPPGSWPGGTALDAAFGNDGKLLALLATDNTLSIWDPDTKQRHATIGKAGEVRGFAVARRAPRVATYDTDGTLGIWDAETETVARIATLRCSGAPELVRIDDAGTFAAALCGERLFMWKEGKNKSWTAFEMVPNPIKPVNSRWNRLALAADASVVALANLGRDRSALTLDSDDEGQAAQLVAIDVAHHGVLASQDFSDATAIEFLNAGNASTLVVGNATGVRGWDLEDPSGRRTAARLVDLDRQPANLEFKTTVPVTTLSFTVDGNLAVGTRGGVVSILGSGGEEKYRLLVPRNVRPAAISSGSELALVVDANKALHAWDLGKLHDSIALGRLLSPQITSDGTLLVARSGTISKIFDIEKRSMVGSWSLNKDGFYVASIAPGHKLVAVRTRRQEHERHVGLTVRTLAGGKVGEALWPSPAKIDADTLGVPVFSTDVRHLAGYVRRASPRPQDEPAPDARLGLLVWNAQTGVLEASRPAENVRSTRAPLFCFAGTKDVLLAAGGHIEDIEVPGTSQPKPAPPPFQPHGVLTAMACGPDGSRVALAEADQTSDEEYDSARSLPKLRVLSFPSGRELASFDLTAPALRINFSGDGNYLTVLTRDLASLWDLRDKRELARDSLHDLALASDLTPQGQFAIITQHGVTFFPWRPADLIREACSRAGGDLTPQEWKEYMGNEPYLNLCRPR
jgi:WD40 repeat protein